VKVISFLFVLLYSTDKCILGTVYALIVTAFFFFNDPKERTLYINMVYLNKFF
jgi:hypothetical protein